MKFWEEKMILTLLAWCAILAVQNMFQAYQIQYLKGKVEELQHLAAR